MNIVKDVDEAIKNVQGKYEKESSIIIYDMGAMLLTALEGKY